MGVDHILLRSYPVTEPEGCFHLGDWLSNKGFRKHQQAIVEHLTMDPLQSLEAAIHWRDERYNPHARSIALAVSKSPTASLRTTNWESSGRSLSDERFLPFADLYANSVASLGFSSLYAGRYWPDERFDPYQTLFFEAVSSSPTQLLEAALTWKKERSQSVVTSYLASLPLDEPIIRTLQCLPSPNRVFLVGLIRKHGVESVKHIPAPAFQAISDAYHFATRAGSSEALKSFEENLPVVIAEGTVLPWAQAIINYFRGKAIGGGDYREAHEDRFLLAHAHPSPHIGARRPPRPTNHAGSSTLSMGG